MFMGVLKEVTSDDKEVKVWLLPSGTVLCLDQHFTDYAGWGPAETQGKPFSMLFHDPTEINE